MTEPAKAPDPTGARPADWCLARADWQPVVFAERPSRSRLAELSASWPCDTVRLRVQRNQAFEFVASAAAPFLAYAGFRAEFAYSDYDDSLNLALDDVSDLDIVWLDFERYRERFEPETLADWLISRLTALRSGSNAPILVSNWAATDPFANAFNERLDQSASSVPDLMICDQAAIAAELGEAYHDARAAKIAGMNLSDTACVATARKYGLVWIPGRLRPRLKAVILDLDGTLYRGVLGEDGSDGLVLDEGHAALQKRLVALRESGLFLALLSRNEPEDVDRLFDERPDFPLRPGHISTRAISWAPKADGVAAIAANLRIATDSLLVIDDNPGELAALAERYPELHCLHAPEDGEETCRALDNYPNLARFAEGDETDELRVADLARSAEREALAATASDPLDYLRSLQVTLGFAMNPGSRTVRLAEMSGKTNQFNLMLSRLSKADVARRLDDPQCRIVAIRLADRLSDSGVIGALFTRREDNVLVVEELCISCRALGRGLEDAMIGEALRGILGEIPAEVVRFCYVTGPRNAPARDWLSRFSGQPAEAESGAIDVAWNEKAIVAELESLPLTIEWRRDDDT